MLCHPAPTGKVLPDAPLDIKKKNPFLKLYWCLMVVDIEELHFSCNQKNKWGSVFPPGWTRAVWAGCYHGAGQQEEDKGGEEKEGYGWTQKGSGYGEFPERTLWVFVFRSVSGCCRETPKMTDFMVQKCLFPPLLPFIRLGTFLLLLRLLPYESRLLGEMKGQRTVGCKCHWLLVCWPYARTRVPPLSSGLMPPVLCPCRKITSWPWMSSVANTKQTSAMWVKRLSSLWFFFVLFCFSPPAPVV